jgi:pyridoxine 5-phosphate synthase
MVKLGVNIDHVASLRQARNTPYPDVVEAARAAEAGGADGITVHLREDRRHIQDADVERLSAAVTTKLNLEMAVTEEMCAIAERLRPADCCLVPERRAELTTEGGLDVAGQRGRIAETCARLAQAGVRVSLFVDPEPGQIDACAEVGAPVIEIHTGRFAEAGDAAEAGRRLREIDSAARRAMQAGLQVNAGHGLHYGNVGAVAAVPGLVELNIGHAVVARALFVGLEAAVREMKARIAGPAG